MEGIARIKERILEEARKEAAQKLREAEEQAAGIIEEAEEEAASRREELLEKAEKAAGDARSRKISMAELEMKKNLLAAKQELVDESFTEALDRLTQMKPMEYQKLLSGMILEAVETGKEEIILSPADRKKLSADFLKDLNQSGGKKLNLKLSDEEREIRGGFILKSKGIEINNSFEAIVRMERERIEAEIAGILFGD